jgi:hypothetical protein
MAKLSIESGRTHFRLPPLLPGCWVPYSNASASGIPRREVTGYMASPRAGEGTLGGSPSPRELAVVRPFRGPWGEGEWNRGAADVQGGQVVGGARYGGVGPRCSLGKRLFIWWL